MEILGIGMPELIFIFVIALLILGPKDMQKAGRTIGRWLNRLINSDAWKVLRKSSLELRNLPTNLMREANMEMRKTDEEIRNAMNPNARPVRKPAPLEGNSIAAATPKETAAQAPEKPNKETESETQTDA